MKLFIFIIYFLVLQMEIKSSFSLFQYALPIYGIMLRNKSTSNKKEATDLLKTLLKQRQNTILIGK
jgi:hypothetical protein